MPNGCLPKAGREEAEYLKAGLRIAGINQEQSAVLLRSYGECAGTSEVERLRVGTSRQLSGETLNRGNTTMQWEFLGKQELRESESSSKGYIYVCLMWRTAVPGGWLLMTLNGKSNDPQPMQSFYPDADHLWSGKTPPEAGYLLRAAGAGPASSADQLLRAASEDTSEPRQLER